MSKHEPNRMVEGIENVGALADMMAQGLVDLFIFTGEMTHALVDAICHPRRVRWRETLYYMNMCGTDAVPIVAMICLLMGIILGFQGAMQLRKYGGDIFIADFVSLVIVKEMGPLMVAMICTGRAGSAFAAEIGTMKVGEEIDAMRTMGLNPARFLIVPKMMAMLLVVPLLAVIGDLVGILGGLLTAVVKLELPAVVYYNRATAAIKPLAFLLGVFKSFVFAFIITAIGCRRGFAARTDAQGVGGAATSTVVSSIFWIVIADFILTFIYSFIGE